MQVDAAEKGPIQRKVVTDAVLYPRDQAAIVPKIASSVKKWYVDKGSHVKAGQLLAELENQDLAGAAEKSQGGYAQAEATYQMQVQKSAQDLKFAKQSLDSAQKFYDGRVALYKEGAVSAKDVDDANVALTQAKNTYDLAQKQYDLKVAEGATERRKGRHGKRRREAELHEDYQPDQRRGYRPSLLSRRDAGQPATPVITVMDLSQIVARAHVAQPEAASLKVGDPATISRFQGSRLQVKGKVTLVSPAVDAEQHDRGSLGAGPESEREPAARNQRARCDGRPNGAQAVVIPQAALLTSPDGVNSVIVLDSDNKPSKKKVKVGIRDPSPKPCRSPTG